MEPVIDAVVTWVDGADPAHAARRRATLAAEGRAAPRAGAETRFADRGEIYWCLASLLRFAPFLRRIHVVTDAQTPAYLAGFAAEGLCDAERIRIVDHREIFAGHLRHLPTFNSRSVETMIANVPDVAEHILYLNDDFFLAAPAMAAQFIDPDGRLILSGRWRGARWPLAKLALRRRLRPGRPVDPGFTAAQARAAAAVGMGRFLNFGHHPHILRRDTLRHAFPTPEALERQIAHRFRHADQMLPVALANQLEVRGGGAIVGPPAEVAYIKPGRPDETRAALDRIATGSVRFGCVQSLDEIASQEPDIAALIVDRLDDLLGEWMPAAARAKRT